MPVAVINSVDQMKVVVSVSEALVPKLNAGDEVSVYIASVDATVTGTIRAVEKAASLQTKLYTVTISIPADADGLLSGMFADVTFYTDTASNAMVVPTQAILNNGEIKYAFVVDDQDAAHYVEVTTGLTGNGVTEVLCGLQVGDRLVTVGQAYLSDKAPVRVVAEEGA
jgi:RND family efflux transporter MFP subunit